MSGFLNKSQQTFDYTITKKGLEKLSTNNFNIKYATFSDNSIVYESEYFKFDSIYFLLDKSKDSYLALEQDTFSDIRNNKKYLNDLYYIERFYVDLNKEISVNDSLKNNTRISNLTSNKILLTEDVYNNKLEVFRESNLTNDVFYFYDISKYFSIISKDCHENNIKKIKDDNRFISNLHTKKLMPMINQNDFLEYKDKKETNESDEYITSIIYKNFKKSLNLNENIDINKKSDRSIVLRKIINLIEKDENLLYKKYKIEKFSNISNIFFSLDEVNETSDDKIKEINRLSFINIGDYYDEKTGIKKTLYIIGKFIQTKRNSDFINIDELNYHNILGNNFSFVNLFTLIVE